MRQLTLAGLVLAALAGPLQAQQEGLTEAAEAARDAWHRHAAAAMMEPASAGIRLQLPGADPSAALSQAQGAALLSDYLEGSEEVATELRAARVVAAGRGYVELGRRYRVLGTREVRSETVLLGYRHEGEVWVLTELRVTGD